MQLWIGFFAVLIMAGGLAGIFYLILRQNAVVGIKTIQLVAVIFTLPLLIVLGVLNVIGRETIGPLVGVIIGFVLSGNWKD